MGWHLQAHFLSGLRLPGPGLLGPQGLTGRAQGQISAGQFDETLRPVVGAPDVEAGGCPGPSPLLCLRGPVFRLSFSFRESKYLEDLQMAEMRGVNNTRLNTVLPDGIDPAPTPMSHLIHSPSSAVQAVHSLLLPCFASCISVSRSAWEIGKRLQGEKRAASCWPHVLRCMPEPAAA